MSTNRDRDRTREQGWRSGKMELRVWGRNERERRASGRIGEQVTLQCLRNGEGPQCSSARDITSMDKKYRRPVQRKDPFSIL